MNLSARMILVLTSVGLLSGGFLASVGILTKDRIALNKQKEIEAAIGLVVPGTEQSRIVLQDEAVTLYEGGDAEGRPIGYAVLASGTGFQDKITLMFGLAVSLDRIIRLTILEQKETPGLGARITSQDAFLTFWENKDCSGPLSLRKPAAKTAQDLAPGEVNTITGATISSEKVLGIVTGSLERIKRMKTEGKLGAEGQDGR